MRRAPLAQPLSSALPRRDLFPRRQSPLADRRPTYHKHLRSWPDVERARRIALSQHGLVLQLSTACRTRFDLTHQTRCVARCRSLRRRASYMLYIHLQLCRPACSTPRREQAVARAPHHAGAVRQAQLDGRSGRAIVHAVPGLPARSRRGGRRRRGAQAAARWTGRVACAAPSALSVGTRGGRPGLSRRW